MPRHVCVHARGDGTPWRRFECDRAHCTSNVWSARTPNQLNGSYIWHIKRNYDDYNSSWYHPGETPEYCSFPGGMSAPDDSCMRSHE